LTTNNGGFTSSIAGKINFVANDTTATAIKLDTSSSGGGISLDSYNGGATNSSIFLVGGAAGISINAYNGGLIGIGHFNGGEIEIGTAAISRAITIGNSSTNTSLIQRWGSGGVLIQSQSDEVNLGTTGTIITTNIDSNSY